MKAFGSPFTIYNRAVQEVLSRLYAEAERDDTFMAVAPEVGRLLYLLVRIYQPSRIVEFGTSFGLSAIHLAAALRDNGSGHLITTEQNFEKAKRAAQHFEQAGLSDLIELRQGNALEILKGVEKIDVLFLDGWKPLYLPLLQRLEPVLSPRCLVVADDVISLAAELAPYLTYVRDRVNGYISCQISLDDGVELSFRG